VKRKTAIQVRKLSIVFIRQWACRLGKSIPAEERAMHLLAITC
jgi:hypothetical protein